MTGNYNNGPETEHPATQVVLYTAEIAEVQLLSSDQVWSVIVAAWRTLLASHLLVVPTSGWFFHSVLFATRKYLGLATNGWVANLYTAPRKMRCMWSRGNCVTHLIPSWTRGVGSFWWFGYCNWLNLSSVSFSQGTLPKWTTLLSTDVPTDRQRSHPCKALWLLMHFRYALAGASHTNARTVTLCTVVLCGTPFKHLQFCY